VPVPCGQRKLDFCLTVHATEKGKEREEKKDRKGGGILNDYPLPYSHTLRRGDLAAGGEKKKKRGKEEHAPAPRSRKRVATSSSPLSISSGRSKQDAQEVKKREKKKGQKEKKEKIADRLANLLFLFLLPTAQKEGGGKGKKGRGEGRLAGAVEDFFSAHFALLEGEKKGGRDRGALGARRLGDKGVFLSFSLLFRSSLPSVPSRERGRGERGES